MPVTSRFRLGGARWNWLRHRTVGGGSSIELHRCLHKVLFVQSPLRLARRGEPGVPYGSRGIPRRPTPPDPPPPPPSPHFAPCIASQSCLATQTCEACLARQQAQLVRRFEREGSTVPLQTPRLPRVARRRAQHPLVEKQECRDTGLRDTCFAKHEFCAANRLQERIGAGVLLR